MTYLLLKYNAMLGLGHTCLFLLVLGRLCLVTGSISKSGCRGESIKLYTDISFNSDNIVVTLYKNGKNYTLLGMWSKQDSDPVKETLENGYHDKLNIDKHGNLWIYNLSVADEAKYFLVYAIKKWTLSVEAQLVVLVAPLAMCKPTIRRVNNTLNASLETEDCGTPAASVSWLNHSGLVYENGVVKLRPGKEAGTYYACTKSPALYCDKKLEYTSLCTAFTVHEKNTLPTLPRLPELTTGASEIHSASPELITISVTTSLTCLFTAIIMTIILFHYRKKILSLRAGDENVSQRSAKAMHSCSVYEARSTNLESSEEILSLRAGDENLPQRSLEDIQTWRDEETTNPNVGAGLEIPGSKDEKTGNTITCSPEGEESPLLGKEEAQSSASRNISAEYQSSSFNKGLIVLSGIVRPKSPN